MPRRSIPRIDPDYDLSRHLIDGCAIPADWSPQRHFPRQAPLELEIGSGKGLFLLRAAVARPDHNFIGVEIARKYARLAAYRLAREQLSNACILCGDAKPLVADRLAASSVAAAHVYFPDPWWKKRHHKRRLVSDAFAHDLERVLVPGGQLHFWTDVEEYYQRAVETFRKCTNLAGPAPVDEREAEHPLDYRTHFERKKRLAGATIYRCRFEKRGRTGAS